MADSKYLRYYLLALLSFFTVATTEQFSPAAEPPMPEVEKTLRRPIDLTRVGKWIVSANHLEGSVSVIDTTRHTFLSETKLGGRIRSLAAIDQSNILLAVDEENHKLILCNVVQGHVSSFQTVDTAHTPIDVVVDRHGKIASVSCLWARQVQLFDLRVTNPAVFPDLSATIDLPFNPGIQWIAPDNEHLLVADHFGGHLALIDLKTRKLRMIYQIGVHNIRGLALSPDGEHLMLTHQLLNDLAATERQRVFWGTVLENLVRAIPLQDLLDRAADPASANIVKVAHWLQYPLGEPGNAAGDPGDILVMDDKEIFICFSGTSQIAHEENLFHPLERHETGRRPVALETSADQTRVYIANYFDDSISVFDRDQNRIVDTISLGKMKPWTQADRGHALFFNSRLSLDGWYSCHSCHPDGHTNGLLNENMSDFQIDSPKRVLTLLGTNQTAPWAWTGNQSTLQSQVHKSIHVTMQGGNSRLATTANEQAIVAFLETLPPAPSLSEAHGTTTHPSVLRGEQLFQSRQCHTCHIPPAYTSKSKYDVGIHDEYGLKEFNPPSLRGISQRNRFFHDNRAQTLIEVFSKYNHPQTGPPTETALTPAQISDLIQFLRTL